MVHTVSRELLLACLLPVPFTDSFANYMCYSAAGPAALTPDSIRKGGHVPGAHIFNIDAFGSGQEHSLSLSMNLEVLVLKAFGGSSELKGASWTTEGT